MITKLIQLLFEKETKPTAFIMYPDGKLFVGFMVDPREPLPDIEEIVKAIQKL